MSQTATITSKRQLTVPVALFKKAKLKEGQKVIVSFNNGVLNVKPAIDLVEELAASVKVPPRFKGFTLERIIEQTKKEHFRKP